MSNGRQRESFVLDVWQGQGAMVVVVVVYGLFCYLWSLQFV